MLHNLPRRHRLTLAGTLFLLAVVAGTWTSTLVGDEHPEVWGLAAGLLTGAALVLLVLSPGREEAPARRSTRGGR